MSERIIFDHYCLCQREDGAPWELGRGGMGVTYKAMDVNLQFLVALKVINSAAFEDDVYRRRFVKEARAAARLRHRNIASVHHLGSDDTHYFYAMEFIDGVTLQALVAHHRPMPLPSALCVARQVTQALGAAARHQLVHRDIKPANLMILTDPEERQEEPLVKVIDFGLVRSALCGTGSTVLTRNGFVGTPHYSSPEQIEERELDARSDIYSLGCTLWFLLNGRPPFTGTMLSIFAQHLHDEPRWEDLRAFPKSTRKLLAHMMRKNPAERPQTPREVREEIDYCLADLRRQAAPIARPAPPLVLAKPLTTAIQSAALQRDLHRAPPPAPPDPPLLIRAKPPAAAFQGARVIAGVGVALAAGGVFALFWRQPEPRLTNRGQDAAIDVIRPAAAFVERAPSTPVLPLQPPALEPALNPVMPAVAHGISPVADAESGSMPLAAQDSRQQREKPVAEPPALSSANQELSSPEPRQDPEPSAAESEAAPAIAPGVAQTSPAGLKEATPAAASPSPAAAKRARPVAKRSPAAKPNRRGTTRRQSGFNPLRTISRFFQRHF